jgi:hypothetical protein
MQRTNPALEVIQSLVNSGTDPSRLLELYYWTREPGIIELIRAFLSLPQAAQRSVGDFLLNAKPKSIETTFDAQGRLVLSQNAAEAEPGARPAKLNHSSSRR